MRMKAVHGKFDDKFVIANPECAQIVKDLEKKIIQIPDAEEKSEARRLLRRLCTDVYD